MRKIKNYTLSGDITDEAYQDLQAFLDEFALSPILIRINSGGGDPYAAMAMANAIRWHAGTVTTLGIGLVASAATLVLAAGTRAVLHGSCWVMMHEDSGKLRGELKNLEIEIQHMRKMEDQWRRLLKVYTGMSDKKLEELHEKTTYLSALECLNLGFVDDVLNY